MKNLNLAERLPKQIQNLKIENCKLEKPKIEFAVFCFCVFRNNFSCSFVIKNFFCFFYKKYEKFKAIIFCKNALKIGVFQGGFSFVLSEFSVYYI